MINTDSHTKIKRSLSGLSRNLFLLKMSISVILVFVKRLITHEISVIQFIQIITRLQHFKKKQTQNQKLIRINGGIRTSLYVPTFPGRPFFISCSNFFNKNNRISTTIAVISISRLCNYSCRYCYQRFDSQEDELSINELVQTVRAMQNGGVSMFVIEGGDPFLSFDRLRAVCSTIDNRSEFWINTTGDGVTRERLSDLKTLGVTAIKISMHGTCKDEHNAFMGHDTAWDKMNNVINLCKEMSIAFTLNTRILPDDFSNGFFEKMMTIGAESGASYIQFLTPRTAGGNFSGESITYSLKQLEDLKILFRKYNTQSRYSDYPAIFFDELDERCIFGCTAGSGRIYMNVKGEIQPCQHLNVSFGNVRTTPYEQIIDRMGKVFNKHDFTTTCTILPGLIAKDIGDTPEFPVFMTNVIEEHIKSIFPKKN